MVGLLLNAMKDGSTTMARIHLVEGPVGAGKSTFVAGLRELHKAAGFILDAWFVRLYSPDRPAANLMEWYAARKARCLDQIWVTAREVLDTDRDVVLELGLVEKASREHFYAQVREAGYDLVVYLLDAPRDVRRDRVRQRNREKGVTFSMEVSDAFFELASDHWEPMDQTECEIYDVQIVPWETGSVFGR
ncbi:MULTISPECIES: AAA family ATPase [Stenotrophomonas]|nr:MULTISPECIES: AAA family ATPase [Stenotrophomonas]